MDIKDSYLHGTVGVVKSISVSADKLKYKLADIAGTVKEVTLPVATTSANGLMSSGDKTKLDNLSSTIGNYVTLNTDQEITGVKTFTKQLKFTVALGTAPFLVASTTKVDNLNADYLDGKHLTDILNVKTITSSSAQFDLNSLGDTNIDSTTWYYAGSPNVLNQPWDSSAATVWTFPGTYSMQIAKFYSRNEFKIRGRISDGWSSWKQIAFTDSDITGNAATADKLKTKRKLWGLDFDGTADVSGSLTGVTSIKAVSNLHLEIMTPSGSNKYIYLRYNSSVTSSVLLTGTYFGPSSDSSGKLSLGTSADKWDHVYAKTFIGNLDGSYINKLTGYTKATSAADLTATDTLNAALGKLEYKADTAYDWYKSVTGTDNDDIINKWEEIVDFIDAVKEGTDITDEFVTRKTALTITGTKTFSQPVTIEHTLKITSYLGPKYLLMGNLDSTGVNNPFVMSVANGYLTFSNGDSWSGNGGTLTSIISFGKTGITSDTSIKATKFVTTNGTSSQFVKGDGSLDSTTYATVTNLDSYVKKSGDVMTGRLTINTIIKDHTTPTLQCLVINCNTPESGTTLTDKNIPGIGFHIGNRSWGSLVFDGNFKFITDTATGYMPVVASKFVKSGGTSTLFLKADGSVDSNKYLIIGSSSYTTSYTRNININGYDWTFWSPVNSVSSGTVYAPTTAGTSGLVVSSNGSGAPVWINQSALEAGSLSMHKISTYDNLNVLGVKGFNNENGALDSNGFPLNNSSTAIAWGKENCKVVIAARAGLTNSEVYIKLYHLSWGDWYRLLHSGNTYINSGTITINGTSITPLTLHQSLSNYVTLNTALTITGDKKFNNKITIRTTAHNQTPKIVFDEYYDPSWISEIVSDYYGANVCTTEGFTHGFFIVLGRGNPFHNLNILDSTKTPIARISKDRGHYFDGTMQITGKVTIGSDVYIANNKSIHFNDSNGAAKLVLGVTPSNQLLVGHNMATSGYDTAIRGRKIYLQTSSSFVNGLTINESGHVGILKTAPTCALDVTGEIRMLSDKSDGQGIVHKILVYKTSPYGLITRTYGNGNVSLLVLRESNDSETFNLILQPLGGKVGIGTTTINTNALVHVNGNILATKFITSGGTSSLFVKGDGSLDSNTYLTSHLSLANYVTLNSAQTISGVKTFSTQLKFTVALGTSPFTVTSTTVVANLNADYWDGKHWSDLIIGGRNYYKQYSGCSGLTKDPSIKGYTINSSNGINRIDNLGFDGYVGHWTVSFEIKASTACNVNVNLCDYTASSAYGDSSSTAVTTSYVKHTYVFLNVGKYHTSDSYNGFLDIENSLGYKIYVKNIKIEKGTKATDWSYAPEDLVHIGNTHIKDGVITINGTSITPLTLHLSLSNYLKKNGDTGVGLYVFLKDVEETKSNATVDGCPVDIQHRTQFKVMRASDTWSLTFGVKENLGWIDCVANGIGYGDIYLNPAGVSVIVGNYNGSFSVFSKNSRSEKLIVFGNQYVSGFSLTNGIKKFNSSDDYVLLGGGGHEDKSTFAKRKTVNDFIHAGNEFTFASPKYEGEIYMNFRTASNLTDGNITAYRFCDGKGGTLASITLGSFNGSASNLKASTVVNSSQFNLSNASWTNTGYTFVNLASGTYAVQVTSGTNLVASGIMSVYKNLSDTAGDEIPLHVYGTAGWRPYLRTYANKLLISSNDASATSRTVTIKIALIL